MNPVIAPLNNNFKKRYRNYFANNAQTLSRRILNAAHIYATRWEFELIETLNERDIEINEIRKNIMEEEKKYDDLEGIKELKANKNLETFVDLCGRLRFQLRWSHVRRLTYTSVLGHMLIVGILSYLFSAQIKACSRRLINNYLV